MKQQKALIVKHSLEEVRDQFEAWRKSKPYSSSPIPQPLWDAATELARTHSIHEICRSLGLDYNHLKKRVDATRSHSTAQFVELGFSPSECILEGERADGARMRLSIKGAVDPQMAEVVKSFWRMA